MINIENKTNNSSNWLSLIPIIVAVLFAMLMLYVAIISTKGARNQYHVKTTQGGIQRMAERIRDTTTMPILQNSKTPTPTPTPIPTPQPVSIVRVLKQMAYYETGYPMMAIPLLFFGLQMAGLTLGFYQPKREPFLKVPMMLRKSVFAMLTSFTLTPAILILYIWALRIGLIG